ncbi:phage Gp37/Gp68 family protein [Nocardioides carbamazepini]|uniref:DUF5131 family protein n=1 Tax=Nocardioides carbamazepini TaxID=2854259 RepID=UPI002149EEB1|nr:phage Gp37/Gp68 family protein [Nocardioides carbamazepini]MCR1785323.1 phage Gp37/Gp68 family protein [Nocardioides carbamazepini]
MADRTSIEWTRGDDGTPGATWNPITGCTEVSPGCDHCYAKTLAERFRGTPGHYYEKGFDVVLRPDKLDLPLRWRKPRRVFVNSMSDLFHDEIPDEYIHQVFDVMEQAKRHTFQVLTKRPGRMRSFVRGRMDRKRAYADKFAGCPTEAMRTSPAAQWARQRAENPPANIWLGVSVENQRWADIRIPALLATPAAVRFLSMEPLLGPVSLIQSRGLPVSLGTVPADRLATISGGEFLRDRGTEAIPVRTLGVDWVIVGGESGRGARPMHPDWVRSLRDQCTSAGVPFLLKQWGEHVTVGQMTAAAYADWEIKNGGGYPEETVVRLGKKAAGRELDGRTWDEFPEVVGSGG